MQILAAGLGTLLPEVRAAVVAPTRPDLVEGGYVIGRIGELVAPAVGGEGDELRLGINEEHPLLPGLLILLSVLLTAAKGAPGTGPALGLILLGLDAVENVLGLSLIVNAGVVAPAVAGKEQRGDEIELTVGGGTVAVACAVGLAAPGEIALAQAVLVLHVLLGPSPQTVEDVLLAHLHGHHQSVGHALGAGVVVLDVRDVAHRVAHLEIHLVGPVEHVVEHFLQLRVDVGLLVAHLHEHIAVLLCLKRSLLPRGERPCAGYHEQHQHGHHAFPHFRVLLNNPAKLRRKHECHPRRLYHILLKM